MNKRMKNTYIFHVISSFYSWMAVETRWLENTRKGDVERHWPELWPELWQRWSFGAAEYMRPGWWRSPTRLIISSKRLV